MKLPELFAYASQAAAQQDAFTCAAQITPGRYNQYGIDPTIIPATSDTTGKLTNSMTFAPAKRDQIKQSVATAFPPIEGLGQHSPRRSVAFIDPVPPWLYHPARFSGVPFYYRADVDDPLNTVDVMVGLTVSWGGPIGGAIEVAMSWINFVPNTTISHYSFEATDEEIAEPNHVQLAGFGAQGINFSVDLFV